MSVLTIDELKHLATTNNLLGDNYLDTNFQSSSYDLRIGSIFKDGQILSDEFQPVNFTNNIDIKPSEIVLIMTLEKVTIPKDCAGTVFAINKQSSTGLLILNPGHIDPGYSGYLSICAINLSKEIKTISIGESIFTLIIQRLTKELTPDQAYKNKNPRPRKIEEQDFLKTKSKKFSSSFFDLVYGYDGAKNLLAEKLIERFWKIIKPFIKIILLLSAIATIIGLGYDAFPDKMPFSRNKIDKTEIKTKDSIIKAKDSIIRTLDDSINKMKRNEQKNK